MKMQSGFFVSFCIVQLRKNEQSHRTVNESDLSNFRKNVKFSQKVAWKMLKNWKNSLGKHEKN